MKLFLSSAVSIRMKLSSLSMCESLCEAEAETKRAERVEAEGGVFADESHTQTSQPSFKNAAAAALNEASQALYHTTNTLLSSYRELHRHLTSTKTTRMLPIVFYNELIISSLTKWGRASLMKSVKKMCKSVLFHPKIKRKK